MTFDEWWEEHGRYLAASEDIPKAAWQASRQQAFIEAAEFIKQDISAETEMIHYPWHLHKAILAIAEKEQ